MSRRGRPSWVGMLGAAIAAALAVGGCRCEKPPAHLDTGGTPPAVPHAEGTSALPEPELRRDEGPLPPDMALFREADRAFQEGRWDEAVTLGERAAAALPNPAIGWNLVGRAAAARFREHRAPADAAKAREAFGHAVRENPAFLPAWQNLGELHEAQGRAKEAAEAYARVLALAPDHPERDRLTRVIEEAGKER